MKKFAVTVVGPNVTSTTKFDDFASAFCSFVRVTTGVSYDPDDLANSAEAEKAFRCGSRYWSEDMVLVSLHGVA